MKKPASLSEVSRWSESLEDFHSRLDDFLDQFHTDRREGMLAEEPPRLAGRIEGGDVADAYLAAVAVSFARKIGAAPPAWAIRDDRKLRTPWFSLSGKTIRATLLAESPAPFRERNLFVSEDVLSRA